MRETKEDMVEFFSTSKVSNTLTIK